jgi:hypothetical protein
VAPYGYLDVGPTTDFSPNTRPTTDNVIDFEDLVLFAIAYETVSAPALPAAARPPRRAVAAGRQVAFADELRLDAPGLAEAGEAVAARLSLLGTGRVQGLSVRLEWNAAVVRPVRVRASAPFQEAGGVVMSSRPGTLDAALLGVREEGLVGEWELGTVAFEVVAPGDPRIRIAEVRARDRANRKVEIGSGAPGGEPPPTRVIPAVTGLARPAPNPFRDGTAFVVSLSRAGQAQLAIYSVDGRHVRTLLDEPREAGEHRVTWDGRDESGSIAPPGVYFVRLLADSRRYAQTVVRLR